MIKLKYDEIRTKKKCLILEGELLFPDIGVCQIVGKNGSGKTLLLHNLFCRYREEYSMKIVNQTNESILQCCSVLDNIAMSLSELKREEVRLFLKKVGLQEILSKETETLSGGEKRLISILRAIVSDAHIIIMDEPTNDLDYKIVDKIIQIVKSNKDKKLFVIVSHDHRLDSISDMIYELVDCKLQCIKNEGVQSKWLTKKEKKGDRVFLKSTIKRNVFMYVVPFLFLLGTLYCVFFVEQMSTEEYPKTKQGQVDIYVPLSDFASIYNMQGAVPISGLLYINSDMKITDYIDYMKKTKNIGLFSINYGLNLESTDDYCVYNMEYYNVQEKQHHYTLDTYVEEIYGENSETIGISTSDIFEYSYMDGCEEYIEFNELSFRECENKLNQSEQRLEVLHIIILLREGYSLWDFVETAECQELIQGNFYIRSNETIEIINQVNKIYVMRRVINIFFAVVLLCFILNLFFCVVRILMLKRNILIFRDYGIQQNDLIHVVNERCNCKLGHIIIIAILCDFIIVLMCNSRYGVLSLNNSILLLAFIVIEHGMISWNKHMFRKGVLDVYNWRYRC